MDLSIWLSLAALALALLAVAMAAVVLTRASAHRRSVMLLEARHLRSGHAFPSAPGSSADRPAITRLALVFNAHRHADPDAVRRRIRRAVGDSRDLELSFYDTTAEDPGSGQARQALADGADVVVAAGGDGTVRMVAAALAGTGRRMGILPLGTGNLFARNLGLPIDDIDGALQVVLTGQDRRIDVGWLRTGRSATELTESPRQIFLVIAGIGADAEVIGATDAQMKSRIGWIAYVIAGFAKILGSSHDVVVSFADGQRRALTARTVLIGNVGRLPGGIVLMPDATADNAQLEVLALNWRGPAGLSQIVSQLVNPRLKARPKLSTMERRLTTGVRVVTTRPLPVQMDGDTIDEAQYLSAAVDPGALVMRTPLSSRRALA